MYEAYHFSLVSYNTAITGGDKEAITKVIMHPGPMQDLVVKCLLELLHQQCVALCQKKEMSSVLCALQPQELISFSFHQLVDEWANTAPLLLKVLATVIIPSFSTL